MYKFLLFLFIPVITLSQSPFPEPKQDKTEQVKKEVKKRREERLKEDIKGLKQSYKLQRSSAKLNNKKHTRKILKPLKRRYKLDLVRLKYSYNPNYKDELLKQYSKLQSKETRRMMKKSKKESERINNDKRSPAVGGITRWLHKNKRIKKQTIPTQSDEAGKQ